MSKRLKIRYLSLDENLGERQVLPKIKGTYALLMRLKQKATIRIGQLGRFEFIPGYYLYLGSAFGPGGLKARVGRHRLCNKICRWHIDYLRRRCSLLEVWFSEIPQNQECLWAEQLANDRKLSAPIASFGSSDCSCFSHLYYSAEKSDLIKPNP